MIHPTHILCHYAEIGLKGQNRSYFERKLRDNIKLQIKTFSPGTFSKIERLQGRFLLHLSEVGKQNIVQLTEILQNIPGIAWFAPVQSIDPDFDNMIQEAIQAFKDENFDSFRVAARKTYSNFEHAKQHIHNTIGARLNETYGKRVDLTNPDLTCYIDLFYNYCFIYLKRFSGIGGLPIGSGGAVAVMLSGGIDSPVAAFYAMKRGTRAIFVHFHSVPHVSPASIEKVKQTVEILRKFQPLATLYLIEFAPVQNEIYANCDPKYFVLLYRRFMVRITNKIAELSHAKAIITGEAIGQVASQTLENIAVVDPVAEFPILRPVIGFDKQEIIEVARRIGTYDISIEPHQDCCTLFVPAHPATKAKLIDIERQEAILNIDELVTKAIETADIVKY
ncbi:MAG: tRNA 4-thiouridine(8) synthase ThiI [Candidatus Marinimicrobia bacterium]|nr:tRNA 4-thiouridine(8) synthase ThiI [Candidatus Neomarinimicrobiota bacterium]